MTDGKGMDQQTPKPPAGRSNPVNAPVDYAHRTTVNLVAAIAVLVIGGCLLWIFHALDAQRKLERCASAGRKDCAAFPAQPGRLAVPRP